MVTTSTLLMGDLERVGHFLKKPMLTFKHSYFLKHLIMVCI